jgi:hypothetical protein
MFYTDYVDPRRTELIVKIQPALKKAKLKGLLRLCKNNLSRRSSNYELGVASRVAVKFGTPSLRLWGFGRVSEVLNI